MRRKPNPLTNIETGGGGYFTSPLQLVVPSPCLLINGVKTRRKGNFAGVDTVDFNLGPSGFPGRSRLSMLPVVCCVVDKGREEEQPVWVRRVFPYPKGIYSLEGRRGRDIENAGGEGGMSNGCGLLSSCLSHGDASNKSSLSQLLRDFRSRILLAPLVVLAGNSFRRLAP